MEKKLLDVFNEQLQENPMWESFVNVLDSFNYDEIIKPTEELENIRNINNTTDPEFVNNAIRLMGFNINSVFKELSTSRLQKLYYMLPIFHEIDGTPRWPRFIEFLLDRNIAVRPLYTADYIFFSPKPLGPLVQDGGTWYLTSHVELQVSNAHTLHDNVTMYIEPRDIQHLLQNNVTQEDIDTHSNRPLDSNTPKTIRDIVITQRVQELFYQFAPIEDVIEQVVFSNSLAHTLNISGNVAIRNKDYITLDRPAITRVSLQIPSHVYAYTEHTLEALVHLSDGNTVNTTAILIDTDNNERLRVLGSKLVFTGVLSPTTVNIRFKALNEEYQQSFMIFPSGMPLVPDGVQIEGRGSIEEAQSAAYTLWGNFGDRRMPIVDTTNIEWNNNNEYTSRSNNTLTVLEIFETHTEVLDATYTDSNGKQHTASKTINLLPAAKAVQPRTLHVFLDGDPTEYDAPNVINQGVRYKLTALVEYTDKNQVGVRPIYRVLSNRAYIVDNEFLECDLVDRDFSCILQAEYMDSGVTVHREIEIKFVYPKYEVYFLELRTPLEMVEGSSTMLSAVANWCKEEDYQDYLDGVKTKEEVHVFASEVQPDWAIGRSEVIEGETIFSDIEGVVHANGLFEAPEVRQTELVIIKATIQTESLRVIGGSKTINIKPIEQRIERIDILTSTSIREDGKAKVSVVSHWNNGRSEEMFLGHPDYTLSMSIKADSYAEDVSDRLFITDNEIFYTGELTGLATLTVDLDYRYFNADKENVVESYKDTALLSLIPKVIKSESMTISCPVKNLVSSDGTPVWSMEEQTRMFVNSTVRYDDGTEAGVTADWKVVPVHGDDTSDDLSVQIATGNFSLFEMVNILTTQTPEEAYMFMLRRFYEVGDTLTYDPATDIVSYEINGVAYSYELANATDVGILQHHPKLVGYNDFQSIRTFSDLTSVQSRALIQSRVVHEPTEVKLISTHYKEQEEVYLRITDRASTPRDTILSSRLVGPIEFYATVDAVSYALALNYDDTGEEYEVSNEWDLKITNKRQVLVALGLDDIPNFDTLPMSEIDKIVPDSAIINIDGNGYVYTKYNTNIDFEVIAHFDDGEQQFTKTLEAHAIQGNMLLEKVVIFGPDQVKDRDDSNLVTDDGQEHIPFKALVYKKGNPDPVEVPANWRLEPTNSNDEGTEILGVNIGEVSGRLYMKPQLNTLEVALVVEYEEQFDDRLEFVSSRKIVTISATKALSKVEIKALDPIVLDDQILALEAEYTLIDETTLDMLPQEGTWFVLEGPEGMTIDSLGNLTIPKLHVDDYASVSVSMTKGSITVDHSIAFNITAKNAIDHVDIAGYSNIRDNSTVPFDAILFRQDTPSEDVDQIDPLDPDKCKDRECVTDKALWSVTSVDNSDLENVSIDPTSGVLTVGVQRTTIDIKIKVAYTEAPTDTVFAEKLITLRSSYPKYGVQPHGIDTGDELVQLLDRIHSQQHGQFSVNCKIDEGTAQYVYFACRKDYGEVVLSDINGLTNFGGWDGAKWPASAVPRTPTERENIITDHGKGPLVVTVRYDNLEEEWLIYRTEQVNTGINDFAYYNKA